MKQFSAMVASWNFRLKIAALDDVGTENHVMSSQRNIYMFFSIAWFVKLKMFSFVTVVLSK